MKIAKIIVSSVLIAVFTFALLSADEQNLKSETVYRLNSTYPGLKYYSVNDQLSRIYGKPFGYGTSPEVTAEQFRQSFSGLYGVGAQDLKPVSNLFDGRHAQPVMYNRDTDDYKFTLVYYTQYSGDIPVFRSDLRLLVKNDSNYPLVLAASSLKDLGDFAAPFGVSINASLASNAAKSFNSELENISEPKLVVWAGIDDQIVNEPAIAMEVIADNGMHATIDYQKWLFLIDAQTGGILYSEDMILNVDVTGNISGMATEGLGADMCSTEVSMPMPYARATIQGGGSAFADENGDYLIPNTGSEDVIVTSEIRGEWFRVFNQIGPNATLVDTVTPPGPSNFLHNEENLTEYVRAQVNGYVHANVVRDFTFAYNPAYPGLQQQEFPVNVNLNDNCNAYYDYSSINFFTSGGGCPNTAFSTVVHHEYGHHLVAMAGSGQGAYGEGMGDVMGVLIMDDPGLAYGFLGNCNQPLRNASNNIQYPCGGEIHYCGQLISGCVWDARLALEVTYPNTFMDIIGNLAVNAMLLHSGTSIDPSITIDYLTLDDDNGNIYDGTPHYDELCAGFNAHNMDCPEIHLIDFVFPNGHPEILNPDGGTTIDVEVVTVIQDPQPGTGMLHYNDGAGWVAIDMQVVSPNVYQAVFPALECGNEVLYYFSAQTDQSEIITDPSDAPASAYSLYAASSFTTLMEDNFEVDLGWTVENSPGLADGPWDRGIPVNCDRGDPPADFDGSGQCYLTDNSSLNQCNSDVDGGYTYLISPTLIDLTGESVLINYALWYTNYAGDDPNNDLFKVYVSANDGLNWIHVADHGPITSAGWTQEKFLLNSFVEPNAHIKVRFEVSDLANAGSIVEAGIDAFSIAKIECGPTNITEETDALILPKEYALLGSYPNPFNARVTIQYALPEASQVTLEIFDLLGRKIETIVSEVQQAGYHNAVWNAEDRSSGMYFYTIKMGDFAKTNKMTLLK